MNVSDLIKILQTFPGELEVSLGDGNRPERSREVGVVELCDQSYDGWPLQREEWPDEEDERNDKPQLAVIWPDKY